MVDFGEGAHDTEKHGGIVEWSFTLLSFSWFVEAVFPPCASFLWLPPVYLGQASYQTMFYRNLSRDNGRAFVWLVICSLYLATENGME